MRASVALPPATTAAALDRLRGLPALLERRRWWIVGICILGQWAVVGYEALRQIPHNSWIYQHGDDGPWYWTSAWTLATLHVPVTQVGLGLPYLLAPAAALFGPNMAVGLPAVIALNVLVLAPAAVVGIFLLADALAGRLFAIWTACLWVVLPVVALLLYQPHGRTNVINYFLPTASGLNALADYPSMVFAIFGAYLLIRSLDSNTVADGLLCGIVLGFLVLLKPANGPLPLAGAVALAVTFRHRALISAAAGMVPALVALTLWKKTGIGDVPLFALGAVREAAGATIAVGDVRTYIRPNWHHLGQNVHTLREMFWSLRLLEFLLVAGSIGLIARARIKGALVVAWFVAFALIKASVTWALVTDTSVYRFLLPAWPAWVLIVAGVVFCWPGGSARFARWREAGVERRAQLRPPSRAILIATGLILSAGPLVVAAVASPVGRETIAAGFPSAPPVPIVEFGLSATRTGAHTAILRWRPRDSRGAVTTYAVFKGRDPGCVYAAVGAPECMLSMQLIGRSKRLSFRDVQATGRGFYRIGLVSGPVVDPDNPALLLLSKPATVSVR